MGQKKIAFGSYAMVKSSTTNTMKIRCVPDIALKVSKNYGGYYFKNIFIGKQMHIYNWKEYPISEEVIEQVEQFSGDE